MFMSIHNFDDAEFHAIPLFGEQSNGPCSLPCSFSQGEAAHFSIGRAGQQSQALSRDRRALALRHRQDNVLPAFSSLRSTVPPGGGISCFTSSFGGHYLPHFAQPRASKARCDSGFLAGEERLLNSLPSRQMACRMMASLRATATQAAR